MSNHQEIEFKNIDHLGIIAGIIDSIGLVEIINELIGQEAGEKISAGHVVKAMILNGLGFVSSPLYMFPEFFQDKPCEHLIGKGVKAEYLNDDKLGRVKEENLMVADAALYNAKNISSLSGMRWLSRVPMTIREAKERVSTLNGDLDF